MHMLAMAFQLAITCAGDAALASSALPCEPHAADEPEQHPRQQEGQSCRQRPRTSACLLAPQRQPGVDLPFDLLADVAAWE